MCGSFKKKQYIYKQKAVKSCKCLENYCITIHAMMRILLMTRPINQPNHDKNGSGS